MLANEGRVRKLRKAIASHVRKFVGSSNGDFVLDWVWKCWNFSCWSVNPRCLMGATGTGTPEGSFATWGDGRSHSRNSVAISGSPLICSEMLNKRETQKAETLQEAFFSVDLVRPH